MAATDRFAPRSDDDILRLVTEHPLAWILSGESDRFRATLLPIRPEHDGHGRISAIVGHFARSNEHLELLRADPRAAILVLGTHGYISPSWMQDKTQAPTWNYASAQFLVDVRFFDEPPRIAAHLRDLVDVMETGRPDAWSVERMGPRYHALAQRVVGFRAEVREVRARFKLGQDERDDVFADICSGLAHTGRDNDLLEWMRTFNAARSRAK